MADNVFGLRLRELREQAGLTQPQLAEAAGLSTRSISRMETGEQHATWPNVQRLAAALSVTTDSFGTAPAGDLPPRGRGRPPKQDIPTAAPQRRTGRKMTTRRKPPAKGE
jgi:transcriptional regulator with XRE-family HTH domain